VVLYELLSGSVPFRADGFVELVTKLREEPPPPLPPRTPRRERIPPDLAAATMRCLEKRPSDRFRSMAALGEALRVVGKAKAAGRSRRIVGAVAVAAVLALAAAALAAGAPRRVAAAAEAAWRSVQALVRRTPAPAVPPGAPATPARIPPPLSAPLPAPAAPARLPEPAHLARPAAPAAPAVATVELNLRSTPPGAVIERLDTGQRLGRTPSRVKVARKAAVVWIRLSLDGYDPVKFAVSLKKDGGANVALHRVARKAVKR